MKPITAYFRGYHTNIKRYPWVAVVALLSGALIGGVVIINPVLWLLVLGAMLVGWYALIGA